MRFQNAVEVESVHMRGKKGEKLLKPYVIGYIIHFLW